LIYALLETITPGSFTVAPELQAISNVNHPLETGMAFFYFSFITMTTVGYGDITPVSNIATSLSALEAVTGQIYLTVLVARLVALNITCARKAV
ncbi:MAG: ion channel, partial [Kiritimatiellia bacterium]